MPACQTFGNPTSFESRFFWVGYWAISLQSYYLYFSIGQLSWCGPWTTSIPSGPIFLKAGAAGWLGFWTSHWLGGWRARRCPSGPGTERFSRPIRNSGPSCIWSGVANHASSNNPQALSLIVRSWMVYSWSAFYCEEESSQAHRESHGTSLLLQRPSQSKIM